jgi:ribonuclease D
LAQQFPRSRNLSAQQPPGVAPHNPYVHERWFLRAREERRAQAEREIGAEAAARAEASEPVPECYITTAPQLVELQRYLARTTCVAVDTEFSSAGRYAPRIEVLQIGTPELLAAVDMNLLRGEAGLLRPLLETLLDKEWVVHSHRGDLSVLYDLATQLGIGGGSNNNNNNNPRRRLPRALFDTQVAFSFLSTHPSIGLGPLMQALLGVQMDKTETLSDWSARPLSQAQVAYALGDVKHLLRAKKVLEELMANSSDTHSALQAYMQQQQQQLLQGPAVDSNASSISSSLLPEAEVLAARAESRLGVRREWFEAEMQLLLQPLLYEPADPDMAYRSSCHPRVLRKLESTGSAEALAVFQSLASWRETTARRSNEPPHRLLNEESMFMMATRPPSSFEALGTLLQGAQVGGGSKKLLLALHGKDIVQTVQNALKKVRQERAEEEQQQQQQQEANKDSNTNASTPSDSLLHLRLPLHHGARLKPALLNLLSAVVEGVSARIQVSPSLLAPRREVTDLASLRPDSIDTARRWPSEVDDGVDDGDSAVAAPLSSSSCSEPQCLAPSLLPASLHFRFASLNEEVTMERLEAGRISSNSSSNTKTTSPSTPITTTSAAAEQLLSSTDAAVLSEPTKELDDEDTADVASLDAEEDGDDEDDVEVVDSSLLDVASEEDLVTPMAAAAAVAPLVSTVAVSPAVASSSSSPSSAFTLAQAAPLSRFEELTLLSRAKVLRGWRRGMVGDPLLRVVLDGAKLHWQAKDNEGNGALHVEDSGNEPRT